MSENRTDAPTMEERARFFELALRVACEFDPYAEPMPEAFAVRMGVGGVLQLGPIFARARAVLQADPETFVREYFTQLLSLAKSEAFRPPTSLTELRACAVPCVRPAHELVSSYALYGSSFPGDAPAWIELSDWFGIDLAYRRGDALASSPLPQMEGFELTREIHLAMDAHESLRRPAYGEKLEEPRQYTVKGAPSMLVMLDFDGGNQLTLFLADQDPNLLFWPVSRHLLYCTSPAEIDAMAWLIARCEEALDEGTFAVPLPFHSTHGTDRVAPWFDDTHPLGSRVRALHRAFAVREWETIVSALMRSTAPQARKQRVAPLWIENLVSLGEETTVTVWDARGGLVPMTAQHVIVVPVHACVGYIVRMDDIVEEMRARGAIRPNSFGLVLEIGSTSDIDEVNLSRISCGTLPTILLPEMDE